MNRCIVEYNINIQKFAKHKIKIYHFDRMMNLIANENVLFISFLPKEGSSRMATVCFGHSRAN